MKKRRVGIFGGTFNPPHIGHIEAAKAFVSEAELDELLIIPAFIPPHKEYLSSVGCDERLEMCRLAFSDIEKTKISDIEIARGGKSYTYLTLQELSDEDVELYLLCGTDMILTMDAWKNPDVIFSLCTICYIRRESLADITNMIEAKCKEYVECYNADILPIISDVIEISSSEIRQGNKDISRYLKKEVLDYVIEKGLYK